MTRKARTVALLLALLAMASLSPETSAQNGKKPGGGGGEGSTTLSYRTIALSQHSGFVGSINSQGQMVGMIQDADGIYLPYSWEVDVTDAVTGTQLDLSLAGRLDSGIDGVATHVNDQGIIAGVVGLAGEEVSAAAVWLDRNSAATLLPLPVPLEGSRYDSGELSAISHQPDVVSYPGLRAVAVGRFMWRFLGEDTQAPITILAAWAIRDDNSITLPVILDYGYTGQYESAPLAVNRNLTVAGYLDDFARAWQLDWVQLPGEGLDPDSGDELAPAPFDLVQVDHWDLFRGSEPSKATSINDAGDICGSRWQSHPKHIAFYLKRVGDGYVEQSLPLLVNTKQEKTRNISAHALDNSPTPRIVGSVDTYTSRSTTRWNHPVMWQGSTVVDLKSANTTSGLTPVNCWSVNGAGRIAGSGWNGAMRLPIVMIPNN